MAKKRMISDDLLYSDEFLDLSFESKVLYFYSLIETDADGIFNGLNRLLLNTQAKKEHLKELIDNNFLIQDADNPTFAITDFHIMNRMDKNSAKNENKYTPTKHITFKNQLYVTQDSTLTLDEIEGFMPYRYYEGGSMNNALDNYRIQLEQDAFEEKRRSDDQDGGLSPVERKIREDDPQYFDD